MPTYEIPPPPLEDANIEHRKLEPAAKIEAYIMAVRSAWRDGTISSHEMDNLEQLRNELGIAAEQHLAIETKIRKEVGK